MAAVLVSLARLVSPSALLGEPAVAPKPSALLGEPAVAQRVSGATSQNVPQADQTSNSQVSPVIENLRYDAALNDVCFVSAACGWCVGDRGVIWHTVDGGRTWHSQTSNVVTGLNSVCFIDERRGWAVGGENRPYAAATRGVVLRTEDGGRSWTEIPKLVLPLLHRVKFFDANRGIVFGESAAFYPSGVFATNDGGMTWQPLPADKSGGWLAGDFVDREVGAVAGAGGRIATLARHEIVHSPLAFPSMRSYRAMRLVAPTGGWLVGDGGIVMTTQDLGRSWQSPPGELPQAVAENFDLRAVAVHGMHVWVAGSPGSRVFHSADGGQSWQSGDTGQTAPLRAMAFTDVEHGWAVGDLGNILATQDGGRSWQTQRSGGKRAALLSIFAHRNDVPLELIADSAAAEGYITAVNILHTATADGDSTAREAADSRTCEALLSAGASAAETSWRFPLPPEDLELPPAEMLAALNRANDGRALEQMESYLVRELRMWRPEVVVTHHAAVDDGEPMAMLAEQLVLKCVTAAADVAQHAELADAGLAPWSVKKVYGVTAGDAHGDESIETGRFSPWLGAALSEYVSPGRSLLNATHYSPPPTYELKLLAGDAGDKEGSRGIFEGIVMARGSEARRPQAELPANDLEGLRRLATKRRHLQNLLDRTDGNAAWAAQASNLIDGLSPGDAGELLWQLADGYRVSGRLDLAADTYFLLARRYPDHRLVDQSLVWLVRFYASGETAQRVAKEAPTNMRLSGEAGETSPIADVGADAVKQTSATLPATPAVGLSRDDRLRRAAQLVEYLKTTRPALYAEPVVRFAEVAAQRKLGYSNPAQRYFLTLVQLPKDDPWRLCAESEQWLAKPGDVPPPKMLGTCRLVAERPHLDGVLDEPLWQTADRLRLKGADDGGRTILSVNGSTGEEGGTNRIVSPTGGEVRLAHDKDYLYVGVRCSNVFCSQVKLTERSAPRPRDGDLSQHDRVTLRLDVDRDFATAYDLTVDIRGWTHDACWGDATWNPAWYVAAGGDERTWTVEAAIPLAELSAAPPGARDVWAVAVKRTVPAIGYQTWAGGTASDSPDQYGLLIFE
jgi:photosystem II stability/assembly factor-like uncharacterized protein